MYTHLRFDFWRVTIIIYHEIIPDDNTQRAGHRSVRWSVVWTRSSVNDDGQRRPYRNKNEMLMYFSLHLR